MAGTIAMDFELSIYTVRLGLVWTPGIAVGDIDKIEGWPPFGRWEWDPMGWRPPVPEYWTKPRAGGWSWQIENPNKTHILLAHDDQVIGAIANFRRMDFEKGDHAQYGDWIIDYDGWTTGGRWHLISTSSG